jgi:putative thioredoxin
LADDPEDLDALYALASCLAAEGEYEGALEHLLRIVECDKRFRDGAAKVAMLRVFAIVGKRSELADEYRERLARALY